NGLKNVLSDKLCPFCLSVRGGDIPPRQEPSQVSARPTIQQTLYVQGPPKRLTERSELERWAERHAEVVMRSVVEIHLIANVESHADRSDVGLKAAAWIQNATDIVAPQSVEAAKESAHRGGSVVETCVDKSAFEGQEGLNGMTSDVDPGSEFAVENAQSGALNGNDTRAGIGEAFAERLIKIIG